MKKLIMIPIFLTLAGCAVPSLEIKEYYQNGETKLIRREYNNTVMTNEKALGFIIGYDPQSKSPVIKLIYGNQVYTRAAAGHKQRYKFTVKDAGFNQLGKAETYYETEPGGNDNGKMR